jgi:hypothetical protein
MRGIIATLLAVRWRENSKPLLEWIAGHRPAAYVTRTRRVTWPKLSQ